MKLTARSTKLVRQKIKSNTVSVYTAERETSRFSTFIRGHYSEAKAKLHRCWQKFFWRFGPWKITTT